MQKIYKITSVAICIKYLVNWRFKSVLLFAKRAVAATSIITATGTRVAAESEKNSRRNNDNTNMLARTTARPFNCSRLRDVVERFTSLAQT